jgi:hypothetical protein
MRLPRKKLRGYGAMLEEDLPKELQHGEAQSMNEKKLVKMIADKIEASGAIRASVKQKKRKVEYLDTSKLLE